MLPFGARVRSRNGLRPSVRVEPGVPVLINERRAGQELSVRPVEHVEVPVAIGVHQQLALLAAPHAIDQHHVLHRVPVVPVVRRELVVPLHLSGVRIERDNRVAVEIVHLASRHAIELGRGISDRPVHEVERGIEAAGQPRRTAAGLPALALPRVVAGFAWRRESCRSATCVCPSPHRTHRDGLSWRTRRRSCR